MPFLYRKLPMLAVLVLSASLQPIPAFAQSPGVSALKGQYAFLLKGIVTTPGIASRATVAVGSFTADGQGNITSGEMDFTSAAETFQAVPITGTYTLDVAGGTLNLTSTKGTQSFIYYTPQDDLSAGKTYVSGSLVETDGGPVVSSGSFYQQDSRTFIPLVEFGNWKMALTGETFVSEGTPFPIFVSGNLLLSLEGNTLLNFTRRVGSGTPEIISWYLVPGANIDSDGRMTFTAYGFTLNMAAYVIDQLHILVLSTDPPQVNPLMSGTITRD
jgi:hypothetical protein